MQKTSTYARQVPVIVAGMQRERQEDDVKREAAPDELEATIAGEAQPTLFRYHTESGGTVLSNVPLEEGVSPPIINAEGETDQRPKKDMLPPFVHFLLLLLIFVALDNVDSVFASLAPTATITIIPKSQTISANTSLALVDVKGRELPALTLSQSQTNPATGRGHQDALSATGIVTFYNAAFTPQTIEAGTVFTSSQGIHIVTDTTLTIPANNPPSDGEASTTAHATIPGTSGNFPSLSINGMISNTLYVKNLTDFSGGRNARDFTFVQRADIQYGINALSAHLSRSIQAALTAQLKPDEQLINPQCSKTVTSNHQAADEAASVTVSLSETCSAIVYNTNALHTQATRYLSSQAIRTLGEGYQLSGNVQVTVARSTHTNLVLSLRGTFLYAINQTSIKQVVYGKPRLSAIQLLSSMPGIASVSVAGIEDNQQLPTDPAHVRILIIAFAQ